jgi:hypothetical protein
LISQIIIGKKYRSWSSSLFILLQPLDRQSLKYLPQHTFILCLSLNVGNQVWHAHETTGKIIGVGFSFCLQKANSKIEDSRLNYSSHFLNLICTCYLLLQSRHFSPEYLIFATV